LLSAQGASVVLGARRLDDIVSLSADLSARGGEALAVSAVYAATKHAVRVISEGLRQG
jgi:NADP-dependent 3-hydroxy acid dehydrogenase YdfG